jgi:DNA repair exonuclease SbcCD ATPase subunit
VINLTKNKNKLILSNNNEKFLKNNNKKNNDEFKKDNDVINLLDNIKNKYQNQENKFIKKQKNMKTEINILKEKLKELSANEALYQVEIEKLKRRNNNDNSNNINILKSDKDGMNSNEEPFGHKLDNIIQKYNQNQNNNINSSTFSNNINFQLLDIFGLDKSIFEGENISDFNDNNDYIEIFNKYPKLKNFIKLLIKKYKNEKEYRTRLEEKTIDIFANDMKRINFLENKLKKYEPQIRRSKVNPNSSLNYSYDNDNDNSDDNISKNFCKSVDKIL